VDGAEASGTDCSTIELLTVTVGRVRCGFPAKEVDAVHRAARPQPLPGAPPIVEGILNISGQIVPLLDLRRRLGLPFQPVRAHQHLVVLRGGQLEGPAPDARGVARLPDGLLLIYDPSRFLDAAEVHDVDAALEAFCSQGGDDA
jgi:purine-binding chemotaxis protein CheW